MAKGRAQEEVLAAEEDLSSMVAEENESFDPWDGVDIPEASAEEPVYDFDFSHTNQLEDGIYHARCDSFKKGTTKNGKPEFQLKIYLPAAGRTMDATMSLVEGALNMTGDSLRAIGVGPKEGRGMFSFRPSEVVGKVFRVKIEGQEWEGETRPKVRRWMPPNDETFQVFSDL